MGLEPIDFQWTGPNGSTVQLDATGSEADAVGPGRYRIVATDATGATADVVLDVEPVLTSACVISEYRTTSASTSHARDGGVEALGDGLEGMRFLWTNGVQTDGPVLRDVPVGTYAAVPLPVGEQIPLLVHKCAPARVVVGDVW